MQIVPGCILSATAEYSEHASHAVMKQLPVCAEVHTIDT